ncbi:hypothetical protein [Flavobacterium sp. JAS]|uniref:hypothetical protein n=1 Tax=Flavobacterium sp. JAS TaxID=2897329 RepID=UPI001E418AB5|nr:hypothetical protein [Flavobacterium sp. JAS]MCD0470208.1 hypothetical protein [Flavobacterium sp. JAS]
MKIRKIIFGLLLIALASCSSSDEPGAFYPPSWVQGTWKENTSGDILTFTKHDITYTSNDKTVSFNKQYYKLASSSIQVISETSDYYIFDCIPIKESMPIRFNFAKTSNTKMESRGNLPGNFTKQ